MEKSIKGYKEIEYEVMRDANDTAITICNMENLDPVGIHTGDSIVVAPILSLNEHDLKMLNESAIKIIRELYARTIEKSHGHSLVLTPQIPGSDDSGYDFSIVR